MEVVLAIIFIVGIIAFIGFISNSLMTRNINSLIGRSQEDKPLLLRPFSG